MTVTTRRVLALRIDDHTITVPLVWGDDTDTRTIDVHAAVVTREGGENLPYLLFLQGGPGFEAPHPSPHRRGRRGSTGLSRTIGSCCSTSGGPAPPRRSVTPISPAATRRSQST
jgi:hypothetical protein